MKISFPINPDTQGTAVADLQDTLRLCLDKGAPLINDPASRFSLPSAHKKACAQRTYVDATRSLVSGFSAGGSAAQSGRSGNPHGGRVSYGRRPM